MHDVSRETKHMLDAYVRLLLKWNKRINLVGKSTEDDIWQRHIEDAYQLIPLVPNEATTCVDLGSGGGLPALVLAAHFKAAQSNTHCHMVESDQRKCAFLSTVVRELDLDATVIAKRIEDAKTPVANLVTARALAPLSKLLAYAEPMLDRDGMAVFPKGQAWQREVEDARKLWRFDLEVHKSKTNPDAVILCIGDLSHV